MGQDHYEVLGVTPSAGPVLIRAAYKARIREVHPDNGGTADDATAVNLAYEVLSDEDRKREYDQQRSHDDPPETPPDSGPEPTPSTPTGDETGEAPSAVQQWPIDPLWTQGRTRRNVAITFTGAAVIIGGAGAIAAHSPTLTSETSGLLAGMAVAVSSFVLLARPPRRHRIMGWIGILICVLAYVVTSSGMGVGGYATLSLLIAVTARLTAAVMIERGLRLQAAQKLARLRGLGQAGNNSSWFITRSMFEQATTVVQMEPAFEDNAEVITATVWGHYSAGTYIAADLTYTPGTVLFAMDNDDAKRALKAKV